MYVNSVERSLLTHAPKPTYLSSIHIQGHVLAVVCSHHMSPHIGLVALVAIDGGGFQCSVCTQQKVEPRIFGAGGWIHSAYSYRPALLT